MRNITHKINYNVVNVSIVQKDNIIGVYIDVFETLRKVFMATEMKVSVSDQLNYRTVYKRNISICNYFAAPQREVLLNLFYQGLQNSGSWPKKCPIDPVTIIQVCMKFLVLFYVVSYLNSGSLLVE